MTTIDELPLLKEEEEEGFTFSKMGGEGRLFYSTKNRVAKTYWKRIWDDQKVLAEADLISPRTIRYAQREAMIAEMLSEAGLSVPTPYGVFALWIPFHDPRPAFLMDFINGKEKYELPSARRLYADRLFRCELERARDNRFEPEDVYSNVLFVGEKDDLKVMMLDFGGWDHPDLDARIDQRWGKNPLYSLRADSEGREQR